MEINMDHYNTEELSDGAWVEELIPKVNLTMVCNGSYHPNLDDNIVSEVWLIHCTEIYGYTWGSLPKISQVENTYR